jgi:heme oxygenase
VLQLSAQLLDGAQLKFYQYEGDVNQLLDEVRTHINQLADSWTPEQKEHCLAETAASFQVWGQGDRQPGCHGGIQHIVQLQVSNKAHGTC